MARKNRNLSIFAPIALIGTAWLVRKSVDGTREKVDKKRETIKNKGREDTFWKIGLTIALAASEAIVTSLLRHDKDSDSVVDHQSVVDHKNDSNI